MPLHQREIIRTSSQADVDKHNFNYLHIEKHCNLLIPGGLGAAPGIVVGSPCVVCGLNPTFPAVKDKQNYITSGLLTKSV
jgi:hypothetical protein